MASLNGLPPAMLNVGISKLPPPLPPQAPKITQVPAGESFSQAVAPDPGLMKAPPIVTPQKTSQANGVTVERLMTQGKQTAMHAVLPSIVGGGAFLPMAVAFEQITENGQTRVSAYLADDQGQALKNAAGQQRELPAFQIDDNKFLIASDPSKLGVAPYILVEQDTKTGQLAYGLSDGLGYQGTPDLGYQIARSELIEADGTRTARFNESYGAKGKPQGDFGSAMLDMVATGGIGTAANFIDGLTGKTGRSASFIEVRDDGKGKPQANDVSYKFLPTGERPAPASNDVTAQLTTAWASLKGQGGRTEESRTVTVRQDGNIQLDPVKSSSGGFSLSSLKGLLGSQTPRQTVVVRPPSADFGFGYQGFADLKNGMTGGDRFVSPSPSVAQEPPAPVVSAPAPVVSEPAPAPVVQPAPSSVSQVANPPQAEPVSVPSASVQSNAAPVFEAPLMPNVVPKGALKSVEGWLGNNKAALGRFNSLFGGSQDS